jgi:hypothetical protein
MSAAAFIMTKGRSKYGIKMSKTVIIAALIGAFLGVCLLFLGAGFTAFGFVDCYVVPMQLKGLDGQPYDRSRTEKLLARGTSLDEELYVIDHAIPLVLVPAALFASGAAVIEFCLKRMRYHRQTK